MARIPLAYYDETPVDWGAYGFNEIGYVFVIPPLKEGLPPVEAENVDRVRVGYLACQGYIMLGVRPLYF